MVRNIAIGSFEPLSSSKSGAMLFLSFSPLLRIMAKTAAASVELMIAPKSKASFVGICKIKWQIPATTAAVSTTPSVASKMPSFSTGRTALKLVLKPPEKSIKIRQSIPMSCVALALSKLILNTPSLPANIPTKIKIKSTGMPYLSPNLEKITQAKKSEAEIKMYASTPTLNAFFSRKKSNQSCLCA